MLDALFTVNESKPCMPPTFSSAASPSAQRQPEERQSRSDWRDSPKSANLAAIGETARRAPIAQSAERACSSARSGAKSGAKRGADPLPGVGVDRAALFFFFFFFFFLILLLLLLLLL